MPGVVYLFDELGKLMCWNLNLERISGYSAEEVAQTHRFDFFAGDDRRLVAEKLREVLQSGESSIEASFVLLHQQTNYLRRSGVAAGEWVSTLQREAGRISYPAPKSCLCGVDRH